MGIVCDPGTEVSRFCYMFYCHSDSTSNEKKMVYGYEGTEMCLVLYGYEIWHVVVCKNHVNMYLLDVLTWKL